MAAAEFFPSSAAAGSGGSDAQPLSESRLWSTPRVSTATSEGGPGPRAAHSCNVINKHLWVFGGWNGKRGLQDLYTLGE